MVSGDYSYVRGTWNAVAATYNFVKDKVTQNPMTVVNSIQGIGATIYIQSIFKTENLNSTRVFKALNQSTFDMLSHFITVGNTTYPSNTGCGFQVAFNAVRVLLIGSMIYSGDYTTDVLIISIIDGAIHIKNINDGIGKLNELFVEEMNKKTK